MLILNGWVNIRYGKVQKRNYGDELNCFLLSKLTDKTIVGYYDIPHIFKHDDLLFIGSIVEEFTTPYSIIWGSGAISGQKRIKAKPKQVCAVRGRLTQSYLLDQGIECPDVFGDPALLLPHVYKPACKKKHKIGLIPHIDDLEHPYVQHLIQKNSVHLIDFSEYGDWEEVIDEINECEYIVSSSLHGLIIADAYRIPNLWARFSNTVLGGDYKYLDYFSGVGRHTTTPFEIQRDTDVESFIADERLFCEQITFDAKRFLSAAPFKVNLEV